MATRTPEQTADTPVPTNQEQHVVIFRLADEYYALDIQAVQEIVRMQPITSIPGSDAWVEGITNLRGRVVPVIDLRRRCGVRDSEPTAETRIVVVSSPNGMVGLIVDAVSEVMRIPSEQVEPPSTIVSVPENTYLRGIAKLEDRLVSLMDLDGVLPSHGTVGLGDAAHELAA
ncbi:MAG: purine-binding chemotaxis protein CheW [Chloroflexi bacterium]|nr:purine-binding chemotaxis protein CheW [Chloroflexota bacterium]